MSPTGRRGFEILRDAVIVAGVALVVFQVMRRYVGDYYRVPSGSMEPMLYGHPNDGDVVWVDAWSSAADCGRGDVVVVQHPEDSGGQLVKRVLANGDDELCWIDFSGGDVFLGADRQRLARAVKEPSAARRMRVRWGGWPGSAAARRPLAWTDRAKVLDHATVPALTIDAATLRRRCSRRGGARRQNGSPLLAGFVGTQDPVDASYVDARGQRSPEGADVQVFDAGIDLRLAGGVDTLALVLETRYETITWLLQQGGGLDFLRNGEEVVTVDLEIGSDAARRVEFGRLDDRYFLLLDDGQNIADFVFARPVEWQRPPEQLPRGPRTRLCFAALGERPLVIERFDVFRDVYHFRNRVPGSRDNSRWPMHVPPGHWFLAGDNSYDSHDSRQFGPRPATDYRGRPRFVLGPWSRRRWLSP